jgi:hypothetical protein
MHKKKQSERKHVSTKRYLILISNTEYDSIYYVLSLRYCGKTDSISLVEQIQQLTIENQLLKSQVTLLGCFDKIEFVFCFSFNQIVNILIRHNNSRYSSFFFV